MILGTTRFERYVGIDYSGAEVPEARLPVIRVFLATPSGPPEEVRPATTPRFNWSRKELAAWIVERLQEPWPTILGIDHAFSFPIRYFEEHHLAPDWHAFLDDFCAHWPTHEASTYVDFVREGVCGNAAARSGNARWRRATELRSGTAKSVFHFDVPGSVAKATHAGLPWLRHVLQNVGERVHFWPFDGWEIPRAKSTLVEVYPSLWARQFPPEGRNQHQHDAWAVAEQLRRLDRDGALDRLLVPKLNEDEARLAQVEGWILGVPGLP